MDSIFTSLGFYVIAAALGFVVGLLASKLNGFAYEPDGVIHVMEDEDGQYLFLEAYEDVPEIAKRKTVIFDVSRK